MQMQCSSVKWFGRFQSHQLAVVTRQSDEAILAPAPRSQPIEARELLLLDSRWNAEAMEQVAAAINHWLVASGAATSDSVPENDIFPNFAVDLSVAFVPAAIEAQAAIAKCIDWGGGRWRVTAAAAQPPCSRVIVEEDAARPSVVTFTVPRHTTTPTFAHSVSATWILGGRVGQTVAPYVDGMDWKLSALLLACIVLPMVIIPVWVWMCIPRGMQRLEIGPDSWTLTSPRGAKALSGHTSSLVGCKVRPPLRHCP
jgi:hypothetical protein